MAGATLGLLSLMCACSPVRHVPADKMLLDSVKVSVADSLQHDELQEEELINYVRQLPNHKLLWKVKMQLGIYNMSGKDTTKWYNRLARRLGEAPVIFDSLLMQQSENQLLRAMINKGYLHAKVEADTIVNRKKRKIKVDYRIVPGRQYNVASVDYNIPNDTLRDEVLSDSLMFPVRAGDKFNLNNLDLQRTLITERMRNKGYFNFSKESISFNADTTAGSTSVDLTMTVKADVTSSAGNESATALQWFVRKVTFISDYDPVTMYDEAHFTGLDTVGYKDITILYGNKKYLRPSVLYENCFIREGQIWRARDIDNTYQALSRLSILKFVNVKTVPVSSSDQLGLLDVYVLLTPAKSQTLSLELEGTNSEGDLGVAAAVSYSHRNVGKGSETLTTKFRGAYESLSGNLEGLINNRYMEYSLDMSVNFPKFKAPFLSESFKRRIMATTDLNASLNYQERPEYTRVIANMGWSYRWTDRHKRTRHQLFPIDIDYVYLPKSTINFIDDIAPNNPLLRYSYEDHFIMRLGYTFYHTNKLSNPTYRSKRQKNIYTVRVKAETAGNVLFAFSRLFKPGRDYRNDPYKVFGIHYAQYAKVDADYTFLHIFDSRNSVALRTGLGVAVPYGNSSIIPFEKRFYGGGANGVRGWDVRTLGPGSFNGSNSVNSFINQCGDIRLDLGVEYRAKLFWVVELGAFIDAGNIWTIHNYENQPGGMFHFNSFYKQLAASYGLGIRLDFDYFLLRFDMGMKAHNPAEGQEQWPLIHPRWGRDSSFHFSIGYPF